jgi:tRNA threonylcarbamoyladenosine biosynthesis protein TsaE
MRPTPQLCDQPLPVESMTLLHEPIVETRALRWPDEAACAAFATALSRHDALRDAVIELRGELGAGKTTFVRHLLRALGVQGRIKSPTYAVLETYLTPRMAIAHFDFYRFNDPREWQDAGFRDVFAEPGLKLVEWPERAEAFLPTPDLRLTLNIIDAHARDVTLQAFGQRGRELLR